MNILKWVLVIVIAYMAGYFLHIPDADSISAQASFGPVGCLPPFSAFDDIETALQEDRERVKRLEKTKSERNASLSKMNGQEKVAAQNKPDQLPQDQAENPIATPYVDPNQPQASQVKSNISDEEIDKLVPAPYNDALKRSNGPLREKYKSFAEATEQNDWDINTQNRMTDALLGNQYSKFIELESLKCRVDYCEVRGRELKPNVFSLIMSEMMLQDWWQMGHSQWSNGMDNGAFYALITKGPGQ
jgi:hypothetical protein